MIDSKVQDRIFTVNENDRNSRILALIGAEDRVNGKKNLNTEEIG